MDRLRSLALLASAVALVATSSASPARSSARPLGGAPRHAAGRHVPRQGRRRPALRPGRRRRPHRRPWRRPVRLRSRSRRRQRPGRRESSRATARSCDEPPRRADARPPTSPPPAPPRPTAPASRADRAAPGTYCGYTGQGPGICLTTSADGRAITELATSAIVDCTDGSRWTIGVRFSGPDAAALADLSFSFDYAGPAQLVGRLGLPGDVHDPRHVHAGGQASGTVAISTVSFTDEGTRYSCAQNVVTWSTTQQ